MVVSAAWCGATHGADTIVGAASTSAVAVPRPAENESGLQTLESFYGFDVESPHVRTWRPFLEVLSRNPLMRRIVDEAGPPSRLSVTQLQGMRADANGAAIQIVAEGLRRVDDADLLAARPLIAKFLGGAMSGCRERGPDGVPRRPRLQVEDELEGLEPVLTRAVLAINRGTPIVGIDDAAFAAASRRADEAMSPAALEGTPDCDRAATAIRLRLQGPATDAPVMVRSLLRGFVEGARRPHAYAAGDPPAYPQEGLRAAIVGSQVARFTVDAASRLKSVEFLKSDFVPSTITRPDGTVVSSSALFDAETAAWLAATIAADASRFPAREEDGALADTTYELPFEWAIDDTDRADR